MRVITTSSAPTATNLVSTEAHTSSSKVTVNMPTLAYVREIG